LQLPGPEHSFGDDLTEEAGIIHYPVQVGRVGLRFENPVANVASLFCDFIHEAAAFLRPSRQPASNRRVEISPKSNGLVSQVIAGDGFYAGEYLAISGDLGRCPVGKGPGYCLKLGLARELVKTFDAITLVE
jgi:hypothetical protein